MPDPKEIQNPVAVMWNPPTLNRVLRQLRHATRLRITRDRVAGTVIVDRESDGQAFLRALLAHDNWIVRYDGKLLQRKGIPNA